MVTMEKLAGMPMFEVEHTEHRLVKLAPFRTDIGHVNHWSTLYIYHGCPNDNAMKYLLFALYLT
jgi:hypothetical protein